MLPVGVNLDGVGPVLTSRFWARRPGEKRLARAVGGNQLLTRPPGSAEVLPPSVFREFFRMEHFGTWVFRGVELKDHPLRIGNTWVRRRVEQPHIVGRELKVHGAEVV